MLKVWKIGDRFSPKIVLKQWTLNRPLSGFSVLKLRMVGKFSLHAVVDRLIIKPLFIVFLKVTCEDLK
jgi:hypothetical protein